MESACQAKWKGNSTIFWGGGREAVKRQHVCMLNSVLKGVGSAQVKIIWMGRRETKGLCFSFCSVPLLASLQHISSIKFGDPTSSGFTSEHKYAYSAPDKKGHRYEQESPPGVPWSCSFWWTLLFEHLLPCRVYDKERAVSQVHRTSVRLGDGCGRFSTSTSELFPAREPGGTQGQRVRTTAEL